MSTSLPEIVAAYFSQSELAGFGILAAFVVVFFNAWRRQVPLSTAVATTSICGIAAGVGARLYWFALTDSAYPELLTLEAGFSSFGAILGGGVALLALRMPLFDSALEFRRTVDVMVPAGLVGLAFARIGCLANGCDYGAPANLAWGIRYGAGTEVFRRHELLGLVDSGATHSALVHPLPIYLVLAACVAVLVSNWIDRPAGLAAGLATLIYASLRAVAETTRSPASVHELAGLNLGSMAAIALCMAAVGWIAWVVRTGDPSPGGVQE